MTNHPKITRALAALDDARTEIQDVIKSRTDTANLTTIRDGINRLILAMPHIQVPNELQWVEESDSCFTATGLRGKYTVRQRKDGVWHLFGTVPITEPNSLHATAAAAKNYANEVDHK